MVLQRRIVQHALANLVGSGSVEAVGHVLRSDFVHHRPGAITSTKGEWLAAVSAALDRIGGMQIELLHVLADHDLVVVHSRRWLPDGGPEIVVVDLCRLEDGLIVEVWEIIEPVAEASAHLAWWEGP